MDIQPSCYCIEVICSLGIFFIKEIRIPTHPKFASVDMVRCCLKKCETGKSCEKG